MDAIKKTWWLFAGIVAVWLFFPFMLEALFQYGFTLEMRGQFGDSFGSLNTLFAGLGLGGLAVNIYQQNEQIKKVREGEEENEKLLREQVRVMKDSAMLQYLNETIAEMKIHNKELNAEVDVRRRELESASQEREQINKEIQGMGNSMPSHLLRLYGKESEALNRVKISRLQEKMSKIPTEEELIERLEHAESRQRIYFRSMEQVKVSRRKIVARLNTNEQSMGLNDE